jgi:putative phosphoesterase
MLIGIMSDTHDNLPRIRDAVARLNNERVDLVLHAGDIIAPFAIDSLRDLAAPLTGVFGNNDGDKELLRKKSSGYNNISLRGGFACIDAGGISVGLIHGTDKALLDTLIDGGTFDLVAFGHTHHPEVRTEGRTLVVNPGEVCGYLTGRSTIAIVDTVRKNAEILELP